MIFETHAHYDDKQFDEDREELLEELTRQGISPVVNVGATISSCHKTLAIAKAHSSVYAAIGVHPSDIKDLNEETFSWLRDCCAEEKVVAVGEIGLDYYWDKEESVQQSQREWFARQLALAREVSLPVIIHSRDAANDTLQVMRECNAEQIPGVVHCYSYSKEMALQYLEMGYYIGVGGVVTFKNAKKLVDTVKEIPLERILLETDSPYLAPEPNRGKRNDSRNIPYVIAKIAELKGVSPKEVEKITEENAYRLFQRIPRRKQ